MKRKALIIILLVAAVLGAASQSALQLTSPLPKDARSMGMGGTFRVFSQGYSSFFGNPAGFAGMSSLTLVDMSTWAYMAPTYENLDRAMSLAEGSATQADILSWAGDWLAKNNGLGAGVSVGGGWVGARGIALGANVVTEELAYGNSLLGAALLSTTQANAVVGLAFPIRIGPLSLKLGIDGRIFYTVTSKPVSGWGFNTLLTDFLNDTFSYDSLSLYGGYGYAADAGIILGLGPVMLGFTGRDFGMEFVVGEFTAQDVIDYQLGGLPLSGTTAAMLTPSYSAGIGIRLFENGLLEPSIYAEIDDWISLFSSTDILNDVFTSLHAGAQLRLLRFVTVRAGMNKGWYSLGAGIDLALFEFDAAIFTEELGLYPGDKGRSGISIQAAIRFGR